MMASPTANKTSWFREKLSRRLSGKSEPHSSYEENGLFHFEPVSLGEDPLSKAGLDTEEEWEILTLEKQKNNNRPAMDSNHPDGVFGQGGNKAVRKSSGKSSLLMSPILGGRGGIKSALKQDKKSVGEMDRPSSAGANQQRSTGNKKKLLSTDNQLGNSRTPSPGLERNSSQRSSFKRKGVVTPIRESTSPTRDPDVGGGNFSKIRDTLRIKKGKKKGNKVAQYSVPELNLPNSKYQDPFDISADFSENPDSSEGAGHEFAMVDIPHNKPEYCDHCQQAAWGHNQTLKCTSKPILEIIELCVCAVCFRKETRYCNRNCEISRISVSS